MRKIISAVLGVAFAMGAMARPAKPGPVVITDAQGKEHTVSLHGDEYFHYMTDAQGRWVEMRDGQLVEIPALNEEQIAARRAERVQQLAPRRVAEASKTAVPLNIAPKGLIILVNFSDVKFQKTNTLEAMKLMFNGDNYTYGGATGSARQYFHDQSYGQYNPEFDVVGPVDLSKNQAYYGQNDPTYGSDMRPAEMIIEACQLANQNMNVDFTQYDNNNDGVIDFVYVVYAGRGEADGGGANTIWPHTSQISYYGTYKMDGKKLDTYACSNELTQGAFGYVRDGIGPFCHEFSHVLGLPDFYNTNGNDNTKLTGDWDIMCSGSYNNSSRTPAGYSAYERFFVGWQKPVLLNSGASIQMEALSEGGQSYIITETGESNLIGNDPDPNSFYIIENRQKTGWDKYVPGHGMLIYKVQYSYNKWTMNTPNNNSKSMGLDIIEADGIATRATYSGKQGDCFPYNDVDSYTPYEEYPITRIKETEGVISFDFMGGGDFISAIALEKAEETYGDDFTEVVAIYDASGQKIQAEKPFSDLAPGMYIVGVSNGKKTKGVKILIQ